MCEEFDYSHMQSSINPPESTPEWLRQYWGEEHRGCGGIDIGTVVRDGFTVESSENSIGLQLADVVANACRRVLSGRLQTSVCAGIGKLFLRTNPVISFLSLDCDSPGGSSNLTVPHVAAFAIQEIAANARPIFR